MNDEMKKYHRDWYHKQTREKKDRKLLLQKERRSRIVLWLREYKESFGCYRCPEKDWRCLDFHHLENKEMNISDAASKRAWKIERLRTEIKKCIILCSNCHRKETFENYLNVEDSLWKRGCGSSSLPFSTKS